MLETHRAVPLEQCSGIRVIRQEIPPAKKGGVTLRENRLELCLWSGEIIPIVAYGAMLGDGLNWEGLQLIAAWLNEKLELPGAPEYVEEKEA